jgi:glyoxylase-like metal-dependent hydrolase (beta-lactamase superfamily II)
VNTTLQLYVKSVNFFDPVIPGHEVYNCPTLAFLITNEATGRKILFDAGARKDYWNYSPLVAGRFQEGVNVKGLRVDKGVQEVLQEAGVVLDALDSVVWSHWHFDHIGDMSQFPSTVDIVVGPGFKENLLPGFPANPDSALLETDYKGHEVREIAFDSTLRIGKFRAFDYFGDGSFFLLDVPGHAIGHMCGLARTTEDTFLLMGADTCHFAGSLRPTPYVPLPETLDSTSCGLDPYFPMPCPCSLFGDCHPGATHHEKRTKPWYTASKAPGSAYVDPDTANQSITRLQEFDANPQVFVCLAHDPSLFEILPMLNQDPKSSVNNWQVERYKERSRWRFLNELPKGKTPGRPPIVYGYWRGGKQVDVDTAFQK